MAFITVLSVFALFTPSFALNYYMDSTCLQYPAVSRALPEALLMAGRSDTRLGENDADIQAAFQRIYNTNTDDTPSVGEVRRIMSGVSQLAETPDLNGADIRIYCDEDARCNYKRTVGGKTAHCSPIPIQTVIPRISSGSMMSTESFIEDHRVARTRGRSPRFSIRQGRSRNIVLRTRRELR